MRDLVKQLNSKQINLGPVPSTQQQQQRQPDRKSAHKPKPPAPQRTTSIPNNGAVPNNHTAAPSNHTAPPSNHGSGSVADSSGPTDALYVQADGLLEKAAKKERLGDLHTALANVNRAMG